MLALLISVVAASAISAAAVLTRIHRPSPSAKVSDDFEERLRIRRDAHRQRQFTR